VATGVEVAFDCADPDRLARFWAAALGYQLQDPPPGFASCEDWAREQGIPEDRWNEVSAVVDPDGRGPRLYFPEGPGGQGRQNRVHLDLNVSGGRGTLLVEERRRIDAEVERLVGRARPGWGRWRSRAGMWSTWPTPRQRVRRAVIRGPARPRLQDPQALCGTCGGIGSRPGVG
jgi:hypothetical protein